MNFVIIFAPGQDTIGRSAECTATGTAGLVFAVGDLQVSDLLVQDGAHVSLAGAHPLGEFATLGTGGLLGSTRNRYINNCGCNGIHACVLLEKVVDNSFLGTQALFLNPASTYVMVLGEKCRSFSVILSTTSPEKRGSPWTSFPR